MSSGKCRSSCLSLNVLKHDVKPFRTIMITSSGRWIYEVTEHNAVSTAGVPFEQLIVN